MTHSPSTTPGPDSGEGAAPRSLLLAEDDDTVRNLVKTYLERRGFVVEAVPGGAEAVAALLASPYDVVLLDVMMPGMGGVEALQKMREARPDVPIIMATAMTSSEDVVRALELGADDYVTKPFDFNVLMARIRARLRRQKKPDLAKEPAPGVVIDGRYELLERIGQGSFGVVYRARHKTLELDIAVKILRTTTEGGTELLEPIDSQGKAQGQAGSEKAAEEFRLEGVRACRVQHENAVRVFDFGVLPSGLSYLAMELLRGPTVEELMKAGPMTIAQAVRILVPVCEVLKTAHASHLIHRDVKPANIMLHKGNDGDVVKVLDFGVSKLLDDGGKATRDSIAGSPAYMSPERLRGLVYDGRTDVYAVGIMLYEMLTGRVPFKSDSNDVMAVALMQLRETPVRPSERNPALGEAVDAIVMRFLEKDPTRRPSAEEAISLLQDLLDLA